MNMNKKYISAYSAVVFSVLISSCSDSDLKQLHKDELDAARRASEETNIGQAATGQSSASGQGATGQSSSGQAETDQVETDQAANVAECTDNIGELAISPSPAGVDLSAYELIFNDEFNNRKLDNTKWKTAYQWGADLTINDELQYYVDSLNAPDFGFSPFSLDCNTLTITAIETPADMSVRANGKSYLSGVVTSAGNFDMTYGYIEARASVPAGTGLWPAFWMLSREFIDLKPQLFIMEADGGKTDSVFHNYNYHDTNGNLRSAGQWEVQQDDLSKGFHTYAVSWNKEELVFYIDGQPRYRIIGENVSSQAMYLVVNLAVGGVWTGSPDSTTTLPAEYKIDYIRAYQLKP